MLDVKAEGRPFPLFPQKTPESLLEPSGVQWHGPTQHASFYIEKCLPHPSHQRGRGVAERKDLADQGDGLRVPQQGALPQRDPLPPWRPGPLPEVRISPHDYLKRHESIAAAPHVTVCYSYRRRIVSSIVANSSRHSRGDTISAPSPSHASQCRSSWKPRTLKRNSLVPSLRSFTR
jgi:hypothetical protein